MIINEKSQNYKKKTLFDSNNCLLNYYQIIIESIKWQLFQKYKYLKIGLQVFFLL